MTYVIEDFIDGIETTEETDFFGPSLLVRNAWKSVFGADNAVIHRIKGKLDRLLKG